MSTSVQRRRGTAAEHAAFTGVEGEITYDTTNKRLIAHDGATAGGIPLARESDIPTVPDQLSDLSDDSTHRLTTDTEKSKWNTRALTFYIDGTLAVEAGAMSIIAPMALTVAEIRATVDVAPTDASLIIDINLNGTTMYTTQGNRPTITTGNTAVTATDPDVTAVALGDKIGIDIDQVGSTVAGENLSVTLICEVA